MKILTSIICILLPLCSFGQDIPQTTVPGKSNRFHSKSIWYNPASGCDVINYLLFEYTNKHPDRVKYLDDSERVEVAGFFDFIKLLSPITVSDHNNRKNALIFFKGKILTPTGQPIHLLIDRNGDGYLEAFGEKKSVNHFADPWKKEGFTYKKAVGITLEKRPDFIEKGSSIIVSLNDNDYTRLKGHALRKYNIEQVEAPDR
jgi:hypothetical protein